MQFTFLDKSLDVGVCANTFSSEAGEKGINKRRMVPSCLKPVLMAKRLLQRCCCSVKCFVVEETLPNFPLAEFFISGELSLVTTQLIILITQQTC